MYVHLAISGFTAPLPTCSENHARLSANVRREATGQPHGHVLRPKDQGRFGGIRHLFGKFLDSAMPGRPLCWSMILRPIPLLVWVDLYWNPTAPRNSQLHLTQPLSVSLSLQRLVLLLNNVLVWYLIWGETM